MAQRINLFLDDGFAEEIKAKKPKSLSLAAFCAFLIEQSLDRAGTLGLASDSEASTSTSSIPLSINKPKKKKEGRNEGKKRAPYPDAFEQFWRSYQSLPTKASKQSKPLAHDAWAAACIDHAPEDLQRAVERQLDIQRDELNSERAFTVAMPDCFRWLRDECFVALLEDQPPVESKPSYLW